MKNLSILLINMENSEHYSKLENLYHNHPLNQFFNAELKIYDKKAKLTFPVSKKLFHAAEAVHGAVYFKALDDAAFFAANSIVEEVFLLTTSFNTYLTRPISNGEIKAVGELVNYNKTQYIAEAVIYNSDNTELGRGSGMYVKSKIKLSEGLGYK